ncbi:MAG: TauD/TfdA family dioxygenase [Alphaproteobacteria bacterium]
MRDILRTPVTSEAAWTADRWVSDRSWIHALTSAEVEEIDAALQRVKAMPLAAIGREDFALPGVAARLARIVDELEGGRGFVMLRGLPAARYGMDALYRIYWGLSVHLGIPISQNSRGEKIAQVRDYGTDYGRANVRGHTSNDAIYPHCDTSDVVGLLCVHPAKSGGASTVASAMTVYNTLLAEHPEFLEPLASGFQINLAGKGPTGRLDEVTRNHVPVFSYFGGVLSCRYNEKQTLDGATLTGRTLTALERAAIAAVGEIAMRPGIRFDMDFQPGDIQYLNNHAILHARTAFEDWPEPERRRCLLRLWMNMRNGRPLAPEFADRLNTGPRGEVAVQPGA